MNLHALKILILFLALFSANIQAESAWNVSIDENTALPQITKNGATVLSAQYNFWGQNWQWLLSNNTFKKQNNADYTNTLTYQELDLNILTTSHALSDNKTNIAINLDAKKTTKNVVGGGVIFSLNTAGFKNTLGEPEVFRDNTGWRWGAGNTLIEVKFNKPVAKIYVEKGNDTQIRAFFYIDSIPQNTQNFSATLTVNGQSKFLGTMAEHYADSDIATWKESPLLDKDTFIDLSFLNANEKPAGKRGFVKAHGQNFEFEDGTNAKFWGTNVNAYALFYSSKEVIKAQAKRLSALGFNLVRIHHMDSTWVDPNIFGSNKSANTLTIDANAIEKIDWWIKCLKDEGIYVWLDLHVDRPLKPADNIDFFKEVSNNNPTANLKGFNYINQSIEKRMMEFNEAYLTHVNPFTKVAYKDEPAIMGLLITNENDLTHHFGNNFLPDKNVPNHSKIYMSRAKEFAKKWQLPEDKVWRSWESGLPKLFLNQLEYEFNMRMIKHLKSIGVKVPIATTSFWGEEPISSLPALTAGDMIDAHAYQALGALESNPLSTDNFTHWIGTAQILDFPVSVTEWNWGDAFTLDRHNLPLFSAAQASAQGWDAMMQFAYSQSPLNGDNYTGQWESYNDPSALATLPAAALMFRQQHIPEAKTEYVLTLSKEDLFSARTPRNTAAIRTAMEKGKLSLAMPAVTELPWLKPSKLSSNAISIVNLDQSLVTKTSVSTTQTGFERNWEKGILTIDTDKTQSVSGWVGGETLTLKNVTFAIQNKNASISVQSLDQKPIAESANILISLGRLSLPVSKAKYLVEPILGTLTISAPKGLKLFKNNANAKNEELPIKYLDGKYQVKLSNDTDNLWLYLRKK